MTKIPHRLYLTEDQMPRQWYNLRADMKEQPDPLLNPGTLEPLRTEELYPIFCEALARQEMDGQTRFFDIPEPVREVYKITGVGIVAGCYITDGKVQRNAQVRLVRDGIVIHEGVLSSLQRFKDAVKEVAQGYECGIGIEKYSDIKVGDVIEAFVMEQIEV